MLRRDRSRDDEPCGEKFQRTHAQYFGRAAARRPPSASDDQRAHKNQIWPLATWERLTVHALEGYLGYPYTASERRRRREALASEALRRKPLRCAPVRRLACLHADRERLLGRSTLSTEHVRRNPASCRPSSRPSSPSISRRPSFEATDPTLPREGPANSIRYTAFMGTRRP